MVILADNLRVATDNLGKDIVPCNDSSILPNSVNFLKSRILKPSSPQIFKINNQKFWEYMFLTEHACKSQFDIINKLISENVELPDKIICLAKSGDGFHGFRNRPWKAEKGNIHLTLYFKPKNAVENFHTGLLIVAAVSVLKTIDSIPSLKGIAQTKWVNDIVINNAKVCGIITQSFSTGSKLSGAVIGLGLNVSSKPEIENDKFTTKITSLLAETKNGDCSLEVVLKNLLNNLANCIEQLNDGDYKSLLNIYIERSSIIGQDVSIYSDPIGGKPEKKYSGKVLSIKDNLELLIDGYNEPIKYGRLTINL